MSDFSLRIRTRSYLGLTGVFYLLVGLAFSSDALHLSSDFQPNILWPCAFILSGILTLFAWVDCGFRAGRRALRLAAGIAAAFSTLFLMNLLSGDTRYLLGTVLWAYIACAHLSVSRLPDPFILALFESEVHKLEVRLSKGRNE